MGKKRKGIDKRGQAIFFMVCLSFLLGVTGGAVGANLMGQGIQGEVTSFLQEGVSAKETFLAVFWKYFKYDLVIWLGGWMEMGIFLAGTAFLLRSISLGFTVAVMMMTYGGDGVFTALMQVLPQNIILIPVYICMMYASLFYLFSWREGGGKKALARERRRKQTEYCILFGCSMLFIGVGTAIEVLCCL